MLSLSKSILLSFSPPPSSGVDEASSAVVPQQERDPLLRDVGQGGNQRRAGLSGK